MALVDTVAARRRAVGPVWQRPAAAGWRQNALAWSIPVLILVLWQAAAATGVLSANILPSPGAVLGAFVRLVRTGTLWANIEISFFRAAFGFAIGGGVGFLFGLANGLSKISDAITDTTLQMVRNIPHLALIPLVILWFGIEEPAKIFLVALGVFFPIYINTLHGIRSIDPQLIEMGRSYGMPERTLFFRVFLPGALPSIFVGVRFALGVMWLTLIVAETIAADSGIGYMPMQAREFMQTDVVVLAILIYALLGKLADVSTRGLEHYFLAWNPIFRSGRV
jgi:sulfonate transport system permease protein